ncbi:MAG: GGDEF domain-containing protein [Thermoanaerobaculia bacterium]|nr:GGDEF domain-containing protein [Thermoanaerobaculia bacterium]
MRQSQHHRSERRTYVPPDLLQTGPPDFDRNATDTHPRGHRLFLYGLAAILVAISLWCFVILGRTESLRADLTRHMGWLEEAGTLRRSLETTALGATTGNNVEQLIATTRRLVATHGAPEFDLAAQRLEERLEELATWIDLHGQGDAGSEDVSEAAYSVLTVLPGLESQVQEQVVDLYSGLDRLWTSTRTLVLLCLLLCASNLGLLYLVHRRREQLETAHAQAVALASHDALTGVWNRRAILRILRLELARAERSGRPLGVILMDLDDFGKLNVLLGSREADHVLREISHRLASFVRPYDTLGRLGSDSFLVILPSCDATATTGVADRLHEAVENDHVEHAHGAVQVQTTLVHETIPNGQPTEHVEGVDPDLLVHRLQQRLDESRPS